MKVCTKCGETKPFDAFYAHPTSQFGLTARCKSCLIKIARKRHFAKTGREEPPPFIRMTKEQARLKRLATARAKYAKNRETERVRRREQYYSDLEHSRALKRIRQKRYRKNNPEKVKLSLERWANENQEYLAAWRARYQKENPHVVKAGRHNRRARLQNAPGKITATIVKDIRAMQQDRCAYCKTNLHNSGHLEHKTPLARGGTNYRDNIHLTCAACNLRKHTKTHEEFLAGAI